MKISFVLFALAAIVSVLGICAMGQSIAIANARIVTVSGPTIEKGTVVVRDGLIESVGASVTPPADAQLVDGSGLTVYPGFIDALTNLGMPSAPARTTGNQQSSSPQPASNSNYPVGLRPEMLVLEDLKSDGAQFESSRSAGFTTAVTTGRTGIFNGQSAIINLAGDSVSSMVIKSPFAEHFSFTTIGGGQYPASLLGTFSSFRQMLLDAKRLQMLQRSYASNTRGMRRPEADRSLEALFPVINRQMPVVFHANRENEISRALDLVKELGLKAIIAGGQEAWKFVDRLKAQDVPVLLSLNFPKRTAAASAEADPESLELLRFRAETPKGPSKLAAAGIKVGFQSGGTSTLADYFTNAGKAVEAGLNKDAAIRAMTLGSAEILGIDDRVGSIENGKIANLTVVRGDLFGKDRHAKFVLIDGSLFEMKDPPKKDDAAKPGPAAAAVASVGGNYSITIEIPGQPMPATLALTQQGSILTGTMQSQMGSTDIKDGKVTADGFSFAGSVEFGGTMIDIFVKGAVSGNNISGTIDSNQGQVPFAGTKNP
ncbi:MAG: amidohydrolase family protein [Pyrinomonadaceae bacterium]